MPLFSLFSSRRVLENIFSRLDGSTTLNFRMASRKLYHDDNVKSLVFENHKRELRCIDGPLASASPRALGRSISQIHQMGNTWKMKKICPKNCLALRPIEAPELWHIREGVLTVVDSKHGEIEVLDLCGSDETRLRTQLQPLAHVTDPSQDLLVLCCAQYKSHRDGSVSVSGYELHFLTLSGGVPHPWAADHVVSIPYRASAVHRPVLQIANDFIGLQLADGTTIDGLLGRDFVFINWCKRQSQRHIEMRCKYSSFAFLSRTLVVFAHPHGGLGTENAPYLDIWDIDAPTPIRLRTFGLPSLKDAPRAVVREMTLHSDHSCFKIPTRCVPFHRVTYSGILAVDMRYEDLQVPSEQRHQMLCVISTSAFDISRASRRTSRVDPVNLWPSWGPRYCRMFSPRSFNAGESSGRSLGTIEGISVLLDGFSGYLETIDVIGGRQVCVRSAVVATFGREAVKATLPRATSSRTKKSHGWELLILPPSLLEPKGSPFREYVTTELPCAAYFHQLDGDHTYLGGMNGRLLMYKRTPSTDDWDGGHRHWEVEILQLSNPCRLRQTVQPETPRVRAPFVPQISTFYAASPPVQHAPSPRSRSMTQSHLEYNGIYASPKMPTSSGFGIYAPPKPTHRARNERGSVSW